MNDDRRERLAILNSETLADALLNLAIFSEMANNVVERLISTPQEISKRFKTKLVAFKRKKSSTAAKGAFVLGSELRMLLQDLKVCVTDPCAGVCLVIAFYETDEYTLGVCDDSNGILGDVFRHDAQKLFVEYASRCGEKENIADMLLQLNKKNDYGVRDTLIHCAKEFLSESVIRSMIQVLEGRASKEKDKYNKRRHLSLVESLARQIQDAKLFEKTHMSLSFPPSIAFTDIAKVYFECGDVEVAYSWLNKIPESEKPKSVEREQLLLKIYRTQGNTKKLAELLYERFSAHHSINTLNELIDTIGEDQRDRVTTDAVSHIMETACFTHSDAEFLISIQMAEKAEAYVLKRADQVDGWHYDRLLSLVESMENEFCYTAASIIYRSLLLSILGRGYIKAYPYAVRYLTKLDKLAVKIADWKDFNNHDDFKNQLYNTHARKTSFWSKYNGTK